MPVQKQIQARRGTAASWTSANPTLADGEIGFETDSFNYKIGNGTSPWAELNYVNSNVLNGFNFVSGQQYSTGVTLSASTNFTSANNNQIYYSSFYVPKKTTFSQVRVIRGSSNTAQFTIQVGLYSNLNFAPNTLLLDFGARTGTSSLIIPIYTYTAVANVPFTLDPGIYWYGIKLISNVTTNGFSGNYGVANLPQTPATIPVSGSSLYGYTNNYATTGLPTNPTGLTVRNGNTPAVYFTVA